MAGLPPFSGFLSKEMFMEAAEQAHSSNLAFMGDLAYLIPFVAVLASIFTFVYSVALFCKLFLGKQVTTKTPKAPKEGSLGMTIPALCLVSLNIIIACVPNVFYSWLIGNAVSSVTRTTYTTHIAFWHGVTPALIMTCIVIVLGLFIYRNYDWVKNLFLSYDMPIGAEKGYQKFLHGFPAFTGRVMDAQVNGRLSDYVAFTLCGALVLILGPMIYFNAWSYMDFSDLAPVDVLEITLAVIAAMAAIGVATFKRRIWSILALSVVGYCVSFYFVIMRAPDLALTQLMVETISTVLYLLVLYKLPYGMIPDDPPTPNGRRTINALIGVLVGFMAFTVTMLGQGCKYFDTIAWYYDENSLKLAGGNNIVNVTLVDFRGFDTMGEITVLSLAAIGVYIMIKLGRRRLLDRHGAERTSDKAKTFNDAGNDTVVIETDPYFQDAEDYEYPVSPL
jgi:multicomponent Na+:H+ antiporter subunit A